MTDYLIEELTIINEFDDFLHKKLMEILPIKNKHYGGYKIIVTDQRILFSATIEIWKINSEEKFTLCEFYSTNEYPTSAYFRTEAKKVAIGKAVNYIDSLKTKDKNNLIKFLNTNKPK